MSDRHRVTIESVAFGGKGIARVDGKVLFVAGAVTGDELEVEITEAKPRYAEARIAQVITPSPIRRNSPCPVSDQCGGCDWQDIPYDIQLQWKQQFVTSALSRIGKMEGVNIDPIMGSIDESEYRNRIFVRGRVLESGRINLGYFARGTHDLVPTSRCAIAASPLNQVIQTLSQATLSGIPAQRFRLEMQEIAPHASGQKRVTLTVLPESPEHLASLAPLFAYLRKPQVFGPDLEVAWTDSIMEQPKAPFQLFERDLEIAFHTAPGLFQQVNVAMNHQLRRLVLQYVQLKNPRRLLDVFCGSGNLSLPAANAGVHYVEGIEDNGRAIDCARFNAETTGIKNAQFLAGDATAHLWKCAKKGERFDLVVTDPPRQGMYEGIIPLKKIGPPSMIYVSCDPTTLARDLGSLCKNEYKVVRVQPLDFFPHTYHVETVVFLERLPTTP